MLIDDAHMLYLNLKRLDLLKDSPPFWWPAYGTFEVILGAILTQNTSWKNVEKSLENLRFNDLITLEKINTCNFELLKACITPSGFYNNKAKYIKLLVEQIQNEFGDFEIFCERVQREWLLQQKGIGAESADSILCYACKRPEMVIDRYTQRLLNALGYEFESYDALKQWCEQLQDDFNEEELPKVYAEFHGMIVEYMKRYRCKEGITIVF
jgi:endonuclease-3 related protein